MKELIASPDDPGLLAVRSRVTVHAMINRGEFPKGTVLSPGIVAWRESTVLGWIAKREASAARGGKSGRGGRQKAATADPK